MSARRLTDCCLPGSAAEGSGGARGHRDRIRSRLGPVLDRVGPAEIRAGPGRWYRRSGLGRPGRCVPGPAPDPRVPSTAASLESWARRKRGRTEVRPRHGKTRWGLVAVTRRGDNDVEHPLRSSGLTDAGAHRRFPRVHSLRLRLAGPVTARHRANGATGLRLHTRFRGHPFARYDTVSMATARAARRTPGR